VGFVAPVSVADVRPTAEAAFAGVATGVDRLLVGVDADGLAAFVFITSNRFDLKEHWRVLKRVVVAPGRQGRGYGLALMSEAERVGRSMGLAALQVTVRDGHGLPAFYRRCGYREVGRLPGALRVADGDDRDETSCGGTWPEARLVAVKPAADGRVRPCRRARSARSGRRVPPRGGAVHQIARSAAGRRWIGEHGDRLSRRAGRRAQARCIGG